MTPPAIDAFTFYGNLAKNYGPPNSVKNSWPENVALFQQGKVAMFCDASVFKVNVEDPTQSQVVGKVGYAGQESQFFVGEIEVHGGVLYSSRKRTRRRQSAICAETLVFAFGTG